MYVYRNVLKMDQMTTKCTKWPWNIPRYSVPMPSKIYQSLDFWCVNMWTLWQPCNKSRVYYDSVILWMLGVTKKVELQKHFHLRKENMQKENTADWIRRNKKFPKCCPCLIRLRYRRPGFESLRGVGFFRENIAMLLFIYLQSTSCT
jgi:hypothetical protein